MNFKPDNRKELNFTKIEGAGGGSSATTNKPTTNTPSISNSEWSQKYLDAINNYGSSQKSYLDKLYSELKEGSYKQLLNDRISASIAREQALKSSNNYLKAQGFGSQGIVGTNNAQMRNAYMNALSSANSDYSTRNSGYTQDYNSQMATIEDNKQQMMMNYYNQMAQYEQEQNNTAFNDIINTMTSYYDNIEDKQAYLEQMGFMQNGQWTDKYNSMSSAWKDRLNSALNSNINEQDENDNVINDGSSIVVGDERYYLGNEGRLNVNFNRIQQYYDENGNKHFDNTWSVAAGGTASRYGKEFEKAKAIIENNKLENGTIFKLIGGENGKDYTIYFVYNNGKVYYMDNDVDYWNNTDKQKITIKHGKVI